MNNQCRLPASGFTETLNEVYEWAKNTVIKAKAAMPDGGITVVVWAYREQNSEWLSVDFYDEKDRDYCMTFLIGEPHTFEMSEPYVPDMTEALHMVGIVIEALGAKVKIGRRCNEVNKYCTPEEKWEEGQTNAHLSLVCSTR